MTSVAGAAASPRISWNRTQEEAARRIVLAEHGPHHYAENDVAIVDAYGKVWYFDVGTLLHRLVEGGAELDPQLRPNRLQKVDRRFAPRVLQIASGTLREMDDVVLFVDDNRRRRVLLQ